jgi:hypothetical protein
MVPDGPFLESIAVAAQSKVHLGVAHVGAATASRTRPIVVRDQTRRPSDMRAGIPESVHPIRKLRSLLRYV